MIEKSEEEVCEANSSELERFYERGLVLNGLDHKPELFGQTLLEFGEEVCPDGGVISYLDGDVDCSVHSDSEISEDEEDDNGDVPFL